MNISTHQIDLITHLVKRNFILRYNGSTIGVLWSIIPPLAQFMILVFVFDRVVPLGIKGYPAFVFTGILPWTWFQISVSSAGYLFLNNRDLLRNPHFDPWILILVETLINLFTYLILFPVLMVTLLIYNRDFTWYLAIVPLLILIQGVLIVGLSLLIATMNVFYRDVHHIISLALMLLFYITPIFYQTRAIGDNYKILYKLNPVAALIQGYGAAFFYGIAPDWESLSLACMTSIVICAIGYYIYSRNLRKIFDVI